MVSSSPLPSIHSQGRGWNNVLMNRVEGLRNKAGNMIPSN